MRKRLITALTGLALAATIGLIPSTTAYADPDIDTVQARVDRLYHEAEQASERYNDAKIELEALQGDVASLRADQERQDEALGKVREQVADAMVSQYQGQGISAVGEVIVSDDPGAFLSQLTTMSSYQDHQDALLGDYADEVEALDIREAATARRVKQVSSVESRLKDEKTTIDDKLEEAESLLGRLKDEERAEILSRGGTTVPSDVPASGRAAAAVQYAMAQVGDSYVYGAAGPNAFDCSGLTMMAWAQAGVGLPHSSSAQYSSGARVAESDLQAGDLVFYYSPISHVGMYIGNGLIVHAANPGAGVKVSNLHEMPYVGAVRPG
ncbi:C40 family peptidase [Nocardioides lijunqiniae]|uniref:C40 family peptidase n=1 Tax=Nocardioides lijunqiniae TaxID=2760832 RepID=UPI0030B84B0A